MESFSVIITSVIVVIIIFLVASFMLNRHLTKENRLLKLENLELRTENQSFKRNDRQKEINELKMRLRLGEIDIREYNRRIHNLGPDDTDFF